jgi:hypothetical protein
MLTTLMLVLAGVAGWTVDDFCGTPPRPWPGPGPGPWIRKILAVIGGVGAAVLFGGNDASAVSIIVVGGIGGAFLASIGSMLMGGRAAQG